MDSLQTSNSNEKEVPEVDMIQTKNKRDQYVFEIRKQKVDQYIQAKRFKLASTLQPMQPNTENGLQGQGTEEGGQMVPQEVLINFQELTVQFFNAVQSNNLAEVSNVVQNIRKKISSTDSPPINEFLETGLFEHIVKFLNPEYKDYTELQYEALWIISNTFAGTETQTVKVANRPLLQTLMKYIWHTKIEVVELVNFF